MNKIGFKNFRRFLSFEPIEYNNITFLVGRNNSGKSTLVKALLLLNSYLKSGQVSRFSFGNNVLEDANIVTYERAKNRFATENFIQFTYRIEHFQIEITISAEGEKTEADVQTFVIEDVENKFQFIIRPQNQSVSFQREGNVAVASQSDENRVLERKLNIEIKILVDFLRRSDLKKMSKERIEAIDKIQTLRDKKKQLKRILEEPNKSDISYIISIDYDKENSFSEIIESLFIQARNKHDIEFREIQKGAKASNEYPSYRAFHEEKVSIENSFNRFENIIQQIALYYLGANPSKQSALFAIRDKNNALAQAIHDYTQLGISVGEPANLFVRKWMKILEVGEDFEIIIRAGEAYEVLISSHNTKIHLADKGMGSVQAMLLIFRLAAILHKTKKGNYKPTVLIEEPELNLHPALQSKLADLFLEMHEDYKVDFIVETHSEYIIRRSQVIVAEKNYATELGKNPFCAYYFPKELEQSPYKLNYREDGTFDKSFGTGFLDEASSNTLKLIKLRREKNKNA